MNNTIKALAAAALILLPLLVSAQKSRASIVPQTPYLGDSMMTIAAPAGGNLQSFQVVTYKGKYRMGMRVDLMDRAVFNQMSQKERNARMAGKNVQRVGDQLLMDLLTLGENQDIITVEAMGKLYKTAKRPIKVDGYMRAWAPAIERAARGALAEDAYREVFCVAEVECPLDRFYGVRPYPISGLTPVWGAAYNEFRFRAAYQVFVDKYLRELVEWGPTIDRSVVFVGELRLPRYDFEEGAYIFNGGLGNRVKVPPGGGQNVSTANVDIDYHQHSSGQPSVSQIKWKLPRAEAEAFRETMQARKSNQLYTLVHGELAFDEVDRAAMGNDKMLKQNFHVKLTSKTITLYFDLELTEEVVTFPLQ